MAVAALMVLEPTNPDQLDWAMELFECGLIDSPRPAPERDRAAAECG
eukprot:SAG11_NODE_21854_length_417_cov_0.955975_1_plen_47_part_00